MSFKSRFLLGFVAVSLISLPRQCLAYVDLAPTIAKVIQDAKTICVLELSSFDRKSGTASYKALKTLKGQPGTSPLTHQVASDGTNFVPRAIIQWAQPGAHAVVFSSSKTAIVCIGQAWYADCRPPGYTKLPGVSRWKPSGCWLGARYRSTRRSENARSFLICGLNLRPVPPGACRVRSESVQRRRL